ncbi:MAG: HlyD family efflux transporter periplasmic adaptor subunit [Phycisphaerae bacterium]|nr:HlyD family efflux transporter periplasmic adaptor subunit [Phycisphaerae bacterium]
MHQTDSHIPLQTGSASFSALEIVGRPHWVGVAARVGVVVFLALPVALLFVPWQQNFKGVGRVIAFAPLERPQPIDAPIAGRVVKWWVQEGSSVSAGDPLVEISDIDPNLIDRLNQQRSALQGKYEASMDKSIAYEQQVANLETTRDLAVAAASFRLDMAREKVKSATASLDAAKASLKAADAQLIRNRNLLADGLVSQREFEVAERDFEMARTSVDSAAASLKASINEEQAVEAELNRVRAESNSKIDSARATYNEARGQVQEALASLAKLEVDLSRQQSQYVTAPRDGIVFRVVGGQTGEFVKAGDSLLMLVPSSVDRSVELWIDGNDAPLVSEGAPVRLQFEGWPAVQFVGWPSVAVGTFGGRVALIDSTDNGQGMFRVLVTPDPSEPEWPDVRYLRQGVRAKGWVLLNRVTLGYEIWRQWNGFPPVLTPAQPAPGSAKGGSGK